MEKVRAGMIGFGARASWLAQDTILNNPKAQIAAICDLLEERCCEGSDMVVKAGHPPPL